MIESYYKRTNAKFNTDIEVNKWLGVSANILYSRAKSARGDDAFGYRSEFIQLVGLAQELDK